MLKLLCKSLIIFVATAVPLQSLGQFVPVEIGTSVNGFQDDFEGSTLAPGWIVSGQEAFSVGGGFLQVTTVGGDPNHLLYIGESYDQEVQEVLVRVRVRDFGTGDPSRGGLGVAVDPGTSQGINFHFRDEPNPGDRHVEFLDDFRQWGTELFFGWQNDTWYWMRLRHEPNPSGDDAFAKIWRADGTEQEPANWQMSFDYIPNRSTRSGFAGITATSSGGVAEFDVDYILIKAAGLPSIVAAPRSLVQVPASITLHPQSQSVDEGTRVVFSAQAGGNPIPTVQWYRNDVAIPGETRPDLVRDPASVSDHSARFHIIAQNTVSNVTRFATSSAAILTVRGDTVAPTLVSAQTLGLSQVQVSFSEPISLASGTNLANYSITNSAGSVAISQVAFGGSSSNLVLTAGPLQEGITYTLVVNNVTDRSVAANQIAANSSATFSAVTYTPASVGNPQPAGSVTPVAGGYDVRGGGNGIGGSSDQFQFSYQPRAGDFDLK
ncbi:MAG TPA: immunoglobulin domain-containing protein, partial [Candidatus Kapabacteria bacterium]|nr:immunoglobulin domain-containing protein [Candidatus Kapabacteria bacterium]